VTAGCDAARHGTANAYRFHGCRCRGAVTARRQQRKSNTAAVLDVARMQRGRYSRAERHAAIIRMTVAGESAAEIAKRVGVSPRTVVRHRARLREVAA
jgi:DNA-binding CsgD family transcriptional regulator